MIHKLISSNRSTHSYLFELNFFRVVWHACADGNKQFADSFMDPHPVGPLMLSMTAVTKDRAESQSKIWINAICTFNWTFFMKGTQYNPILMTFQKNKIYLGNATWEHGGHSKLHATEKLLCNFAHPAPFFCTLLWKLPGFSCIFLTVEHVGSLLPFHCQREGVCPRLSSLHHLCRLCLWCCSQVRSSKRLVFSYFSYSCDKESNGHIGDINRFFFFFFA